MHPSCLLLPLPPQSLLYASTSSPSLSPSLSLPLTRSDSPPLSLNLNLNHHHHSDNSHFSLPFTLPTPTPPLTFFNTIKQDPIQILSLLPSSSGSGDCAVTFSPLKNAHANLQSVCQSKLPLRSPLLARPTHSITFTISFRKPSFTCLLCNAVKATTIQQELVFSLLSNGKIPLPRYTSYKAGGFSQGNIH